MSFLKNGQPATTIDWTIVPTFEDGETEYTAADHLGMELGREIDGAVVEHVSVPAAFDVGQWPLDQLNLPRGDSVIYLRTVPKAPNLPSDWSVGVAVTYVLKASAPGFFDVS